MLILSKKVISPNDRLVTSKAIIVEKKHLQLERHSKGQFYKNTAYLFRDVPYFAFVDTNAVLVRENDNDYIIVCGRTQFAPTEFPVNDFFVYSSLYILS